MCDTAHSVFLAFGWFRRQGELNRSKVEILHLRRMVEHCFCASGSVPSAAFGSIWLSAPTRARLLRQVLESQTSFQIPNVKKAPEKQSENNSRVERFCLGASYSRSQIA
jgi:hypothetical protein